MRRAARVDRNQPEIIAHLRANGVSVQPLHMVGKGCPDLLCGYKGRTYLLELKDDEQTPSHQRLTDDQVRWHGAWGGQVAVVINPTDAFAVIQRLHLALVPCT